MTPVRQPVGALGDDGSTERPSPPCTVGFFLGRSWFLMSVVLCVLALLLTAHYVGTAFEHRISARTSATETRYALRDLRDTVWLPVEWVVQGRDPYDVAAFLALAYGVSASLLWASTSRATTAPSS